MRQVVTGTRLTQVWGTIRVTVHGTCLYWHSRIVRVTVYGTCLRALLGDVLGDRVRVLPVLGLGAHLGHGDRHAPHDRPGLRSCRRCRAPSCSTFPGRSGRSVTGHLLDALLRHVLADGDRHLLDAGLAHHAAGGDRDLLDAFLGDQLAGRDRHLLADRVREPACRPSPAPACGRPATRRPCSRRSRPRCAGSRPSFRTRCRGTRTRQPLMHTVLPGT